MKRTAFLLPILLVGLLLRIYNLDFPSIGYHNMRENEFLSIAKEMTNSADYINKKVYFYNAFAQDQVVKNIPQPPLVAYQAILSWKLLGENLWGVRLFNVIFGLLSILVIYFIARLLFTDLNLALYCAFLLAIMPLAVFFSRNLQPESPAFFFMLLGNLFYIKYAVNLKKYNLILGGLSMFCAWLYSFNFIFGAIPFLFCLPYRSLFKEKKALLKTSLTFILPYLAIPAVIFLLHQLGQWEFSKPAGIKLDIFSYDYWKNYSTSILWYTKGENYTQVFSILALLGALLALFKGSGLLNRYIIGWLMAAVVYCIVYSAQIHDQSFAQMPFLGMVCITSAYAILYACDTIKKFFHKDLIVYVMAASILISVPFVYGSLSRMFGTVFYGEDVAGESIREFTRPEERAFLNTYAQGYGIARYAQRYVGWVDNLAEFKETEKNKKIRYLCFYPAEFIYNLKTNSPEWFEYIQNNYHVKEVGLSEDINKVFYLILEKGEGSDPKAFLENFSGKKQLRTIYKLFGSYIFFYSIRPEIAPKAGLPSGGA